MRRRKNPARDRNTARDEKTGALCGRYDFENCEIRENSENDIGELKSRPPRKTEWAGFSAHQLHISCTSVSHQLPRTRFQLIPDDMTLSLRRTFMPLMVM